MFGTSGVRGPIGVEVTADLAVSIGRAVASEGAERVVVGRDVRESGSVLKSALNAGLRECGADVIDTGIAATPTIARAVKSRDADVGIAITASHNPPEDNGFKLWNQSGQAFTATQRDTITKIVREEAFRFRSWDTLGSIEKWTGARRNHVDGLIDVTPTIEDLSVIVDVGNGTGGITADVLYELGCTVETLNAQEDGRFPARSSEPTPESCTSLCQTVTATGADLGIAHDGDADRMMAVTDHGEFVQGDILLALFGREAAGDGDRVAAPVNTSLIVDDALNEVGACLTRTRVGDVYVAERLTDDDVVFGGEMSGAWIWPEETLCPDGILAACRLVTLVDEHGPLSELVETIGTYPIRREAIPISNKRNVMDRVVDDVLATYDTTETMDGVRVDLGDAWFLVRASGTQPLVRITAEARTEGRLNEVFSEARSIVTASANVSS